MAVTIKDVAERTGLSVGTISKYLNGGSVRPANKRLIDKTIRDLHFIPNDVARSLKTSHTRTIGVIIPELTKPFATAIVSEIEDILRSHDYAVFVTDARSDVELDKAAVSFMLNKQVDGLISSPTDATGACLDLAVERGTPIVLLDCLLSPPPPRSAAVIIDNVEAAYQGTRYLISQGHRDIGVVLGREEIYTTHKRFEGYKKALDEAGIPLCQDRLAYGDYTLIGGYQAALELLSRPDLPSAIFSTNYEMTIGTIKALNELKLRVPNDISFLGFDHLDMLDAVYPQLTTVCQPHHQIAAHAAEQILRLLNENNDVPHEIITLPTELVIGRTVRNLNEAK